MKEIYEKWWDDGNKVFQITNYKKHGRKLEIHLYLDLELMEQGSRKEISVWIYT